jgi:hypothetical protein
MTNGGPTAMPIWLDSWKGGEECAEIGGLPSLDVTSGVHYTSSLSLILGRLPLFPEYLEQTVSR